MKLKFLAASVAAITIAPLASAGVTVTPLIGGHYSDLEATNDAQRDLFKTGKNLYLASDGSPLTAADDGYVEGHPNNGGVSKESSLAAGLAVGIDITPSTQVQVEYLKSDAQAEASENSADGVGNGGKGGGVNHFDLEQQLISANLLVGAEQFLGVDADRKLKPYFLVGAGQSKINVAAQRTIEGMPNGIQATESGKDIPAGTEVSESTDTIGNLGLGATYAINDNVSLRGEARAVHNFDNDWWEGLGLAGVEVALGRSKPAPVVPAKEIKVEKPAIIPVVNKPVDSDRDGVIDAQDACPGTATNLVVDARGCPRKVPMSEQLKMELRVFFDNDKSVIKQQYKPEIAKVANKMREFPNSTAQIEGHASKTGPSARYNQRLSEARAVAVKSALANEFGVNPARMSTKGFGYSRPIAPNDTAEGRAMNRRVYAVITGDKSVTVDETKDMVK